MGCRYRFGGLAGGGVMGSERGYKMEKKGGCQCKIFKNSLKMEYLGRKKTN